MSSIYQPCIPVFSKSIPAFKQGWIPRPFKRAEQKDFSAVSEQVATPATTEIEDLFGVAVKEKEVSCHGPMMHCGAIAPT